MSAPASHHRAALRATPAANEFFVGRHQELKAAQDALHAVSAGVTERVFFGFAGRSSVGKTALANTIRRRAKALERVTYAHVEIADPYSLDFFNELVRVRNAIASDSDHIDFSTFDLAALLFELRFRRPTCGRSYPSAFDPRDLLSEALSDFVKDGAKFAVETASGSGIVGAAGALVVRGAGDPIGILTAAMLGCLAAGTTAAAALAVKCLLWAAFKRARIRGTIRRDQRLGELIELGDYASYQHYYEALPLILARCINESIDRVGSGAFCLVVDAAERLNHRDPDHPARSVAEQLGALNCAATRSMIISFSRVKSRRWLFSCYRYEIAEHDLYDLSVDEIVLDLEEIYGFSSERARAAVRRLNDGACDRLPAKKLRDWWLDRHAAGLEN